MWTCALLEGSKSITLPFQSTPPSRPTPPHPPRQALLPGSNVLGLSALTARTCSRIRRRRLSEPLAVVPYLLGSGLIASIYKDGSTLTILQRHACTISSTLSISVGPNEVIDGIVLRLQGLLKQRTGLGARFSDMIIRLDRFFLLVLDKVGSSLYMLRLV